MSDKVESLTGEVKKLKAKLAEVKGGGAAATAQKRKKKPVREIDVVRGAKKKLRRASARLSVEKGKVARQKKKEAEAAAK